MIAAHTKVVRKYAQAWFQQYDVRSRDLAWFERVQGAIQFLQEHRERFVYSSPEVYKAFFNAFELYDQALASLLELLERHHRLKFLAPVLEAVLVRYKEYHGYEDCYITSAAQLSDEQKHVLTRYLEAASGKKLLCSYGINTGLIAGVRAQAETFVWEDSVAQKMRMLDQL